MISDIEGASNDQEDIIVFGKDSEEHDKALKHVLDLVRESGLKLKRKCTMQCFHSEKNNFLLHNPKLPFFPNLSAKYPSKLTDLPGN